MKKTIKQHTADITSIITETIEQHIERAQKEVLEKVGLMIEAQYEAYKKVLDSEESKTIYGQSRGERCTELFKLRQILRSKNILLCEIQGKLWNMYFNIEK